MSLINVEVTTRSQKIYSLEEEKVLELVWKICEEESYYFYIYDEPIPASVIINSSFIKDVVNDEVCFEDLYNHHYSVKNWQFEEIYWAVFVNDLFSMITDVITEYYSNKTVENEEEEYYCYSSKY